MYLHTWIWRERKWTIGNKSDLELPYSNAGVKVGGEGEITL